MDNQHQNLVALSKDQVEQIRNAKNILYDSNGYVYLAKLTPKTASESSPANACEPYGVPVPVSSEERLIEDISNECVKLILSNIPVDEGQFDAMNRIRKKISLFWDEESHQSRDTLVQLDNRVSRLGEYIKATHTGH